MDRESALRAYRRPTLPIARHTRLTPTTRNKTPGYRRLREQLEEGRSGKTASTWSAYGGDQGRRATQPVVRRIEEAWDANDLAALDDLFCRTLSSTTRAGHATRSDRRNNGHQA